MAGFEPVVFVGESDGSMIVALCPADAAPLAGKVTRTTHAGYAICGVCGESPADFYGVVFWADPQGGHLPLCDRDLCVPGCPRRRFAEVGDYWFPGRRG